MPNDGYFNGGKKEHTKGEEEGFDIGTLFKGNAGIILISLLIIGYLHKK